MLYNLSHAMAEWQSSPFFLGLAHWRLNLLHSIPKKYQVQDTIHKVVLVKKGKQKNIT